jgi:hypothetical protein
MILLVAGKIPAAAGRAPVYRIAVAGSVVKRIYPVLITMDGKVIARLHRRVRLNTRLLKMQIQLSRKEGGAVRPSVLMLLPTHDLENSRQEDGSGREGYIAVEINAAQ